MAERSFKEEVGKLRLGAGEEFRGEGILAITKALLQSGVSYVGGYQGAPISHLMDVLADAKGMLEELGVHFENSANEATAAATLGASMNYPLRGAVTFKSTVGTNVASDALANLASGGVTGGALIIVGEDYGEGSSIMQERSHAVRDEIADLADGPAPEPALHRQRREEGLRALRGHQHAGDAGGADPRLPCARPIPDKDNRAARLHAASDAMENPRRQVDRIVLPPASYLHEKEKIEKRWPAAVKFIEDAEAQRVLRRRPHGDRHRDAGRDVQHDMRALELPGLPMRSGAAACRSMCSTSPIR